MKHATSVTIRSNREAVALTVPRRTYSAGAIDGQPWYIADGIEILMATEPDEKLEMIQLGRPIHVQTSARTILVFGADQFGFLLSALGYKPQRLTGPVTVGGETYVKEC